MQYIYRGDGTVNRRKKKCWENQQQKKKNLRSHTRSAIAIQHILLLLILHFPRQYCLFYCTDADCFFLRCSFLFLARLCLSFIFSFFFDFVDTVLWVCVCARFFPFYFLQLVYLFLFCFFAPSICSHIIHTHSVFRLLIFAHVSRVFKQNCLSTFENRIFSNVYGLFRFTSFSLSLACLLACSFVYDHCTVSILSISWIWFSFENMTNVSDINGFVFFFSSSFFLLSLFISTASLFYRDAEKWKENRKKESMKKNTKNREKLVMCVHFIGFFFSIQRFRLIFLIAFRCRRWYSTVKKEISKTFEIRTNQEHPVDRKHTHEAIRERRR